MDYTELRHRMVSNQLVGRGITDTRVLEAMRRVPRHLFVSEGSRDGAYDDMAMPIAAGQTISQPYMVAIMTELLELKGTEKVLEVGTGSGYQAAVLAELAKDVYTIESIAELSETAAGVIRSLGYTNVHFNVGDGTLGWPEEGPFDKIIVTAGAPSLPDSLVSQLAEGGSILAPIGSKFSQQLIRGIKTSNGLKEERFTPCVFVPLVGREGWSS